MSSQIDPLILQKLQAFSRRRRNLLLFRGFCAAVAALLVALLVIAGIDYLVRLPDWARWALSLSAYAAVLIVEWRACLRLLIQAPGPQRLARLIEHAEPKLREDLLSAVELGSAASGAAFDSAQFRALLQRDVAGRMEGVNVERLLPMALVRRSLGMAVAVGLVCVAIFAASGWPFGALMIRALLPMANVARISRVKVQVVEPQPANLRVPQGDTVQLIVEISGQRATKAELETMTKSGGRALAPMTPLGENRFTTTVQVGREDVVYRAFAGDGETVKYRLESMERPAVVEFQKTYLYPEYTRLATKRVTEENGDLAAIEGTQVELRLKANQKVREGELRLELGKKTMVVPLQEDGGDLVGKVPLTASGSYRVRLVGEASGFENKFSPEYELRVEPDLVPKVELDSPKRDLLLPASEVVEVQGAASDDIALATVSQMFKINNGAWQEVALAKDAGPRMTIDRRWDLLETGARAGDLVTMKLAAVDVKGNRSESRPLQVTISAAGFDPKRRAALDARRALWEALRAQQVAAAEAASSTAQVEKSFAQASESEVARKRSLSAAAAALADLTAKNAAVVEQVNVNLRESPAGHAAAEMVLSARNAALVKVSALSIRGALDASANLPTADAQEFVQSAVKEAQQTAARAKLVVESEQVFLVSDELDALCENFLVVGLEQGRLDEIALEIGNDTARWAQLAERIRVALTQIQGLEDIMENSAEHAPEARAQRLRTTQAQLNRSRIAVERLLSVRVPSNSLLKPLLGLTKAVNEWAGLTMQLQSGGQTETARAYSDLRADTGPAYAIFARLQQGLEAVRSDLAAGTKTALQDGKWQAAATLLKAHGDAEEKCADGDSYFVNDVRTTSLALDGLRDRSVTLPAAERAQQLGTLTQRFALLEGGHEVAELYAGLNRLVAAEKWEGMQPKARIVSPREWSWLEGRLRALPTTLEQVPAPVELKPVLNQAQDLLSQLVNDPMREEMADEMRLRHRLDRPLTSRAGQAEILASRVRAILDLLRPSMEEARKDLARMAPSFAEMMERLAREAEELKKDTAAQTGRIEEREPAETRAEADRMLAAQTSLNTRVDALKDALRADANRQDVLEKDARERARDADDALAMLKEPPPRAAEGLRSAAQSEGPAQQEKALGQAATQQQKLADVLRQLARHYENLDKGKPEETRVALRATETENGTKAELDRQFDRAERLAQMAQHSPQEMLNQLEKSLPQNPQMAQELSAIAKNTLEEAEGKLGEASKKESAVAQQIARAANPPVQPTARQAAEKAAEVARQAAQAAHTAREAANNAVQAAEAAKNVPVADLAREARAQAEQAAQSAREAEQSARTAAQQESQPAQMAESARAAAAQAAEAAKSAQQASQAAFKAQATARQSMKQGDPQQAQNQEAVKQGVAAQGIAQQAAQAAQTAQTAAEQVIALTQPPPMSPTPDADPKLAAAAQAQPQIAQAAGEAGENIARAGRHEERLQNAGTGEKLQQLGKAVQDTAQQQVPEAQRALTEAAQAAQAQPAVNAADEKLRTQLGQVATALKSGQQSQSAASQQQGAPSALPNGQNSGQQPGQQAGPQSGQPDGQSGSPEASANRGQLAAPGSAPASPQEQMWMARALDALDAALHAQAQSPGSSQSQPGQQASQTPSGQSPQPGQGQQSGQSEAMGAAQSAMASAAQSAASAMKTGRSEQSAAQPSGPLAQGGQQAVSTSGAQAQAAGLAHSPLAEAQNSTGEWGKLPKRMAEELTQGQREGTAGEYRNQIETYYRVIAEKAKKP